MSKIIEEHNKSNIQGNTTTQLNNESKQFKMFEEHDLKEKEINNKYLSAKEDILKSKKNKGEKDEILVQTDLYHLNETHQYGKLIVMFGEVGEEASEGISILNISTDEEILDMNDIKKTGKDFKADCKIKMKKTVYNTLL